MSTDSWGDLSTKQFYSKDDVEAGPIQVTIKGFRKTEVTNDGEVQKLSVMDVNESDRGVVLKTTTIDQLKELFGTPGQAVGKSVELYLDPSVVFGGKKVGGVRFRAPTEAGKRADGNPF